MDHRTDKPGIELDRFDIARVFEYNEAAELGGTLPVVPECFGGKRFDTDSLIGLNHIRLSESVTIKLSNLVLDAVGVYGADYLQAMEQFEKEQAHNVPVPGFIHYYGAVMAEAAMNHSYALSFAEDIKRCLTESQELLTARSDVPGTSAQ